MTASSTKCLLRVMLQFFDARIHTTVRWYSTFGLLAWRFQRRGTFVGLDDRVTQKAESFGERTSCHPYVV